MDSIIFAGLTAISTTLAARYASLAYRRKMNAPIRVLKVVRYGEFAVVVMDIHPAEYQVRIDRICCRHAKGIALAPSWHGVEDYAALLREVVHVRSLPVSIELLPASLNPSGRYRLMLSIALKSSPSRVKLVFKAASSCLMAHSKIKLMISNETE